MEKQKLWQNGKIIRMLDDATAGEEPLVSHYFTGAMDGTVEFWLGTNDVTEEWRVGLKESGGTVILLGIWGGKLHYMDHNPVWVEIQAVSSDTWYHIKVVWRDDTPNDKFDVYVDGVKQVDDIRCRGDQSTGISECFLTCIGDSTDYFYFDAYGNVADASYSAGDNEQCGGGIDENIAFVDSCLHSNNWVEIMESIGNHKNVLRLISPTESLEHVRHDFPN